MSPTSRERISATVARRPCFEPNPAWLWAAIRMALAGACGTPPDDSIASKQASLDLGPGLFEIDGNDPELPTHDLKPLGEIVASSKYVGLGEVMHTSGGIERMKDRVVRYLVEKKGFRALGLENSWLLVDHLQSYIQTCQGDI